MQKFTLDKLPKKILAKIDVDVSSPPNSLNCSGNLKVRN